MYPEGRGSAASFFVGFIGKGCFSSIMCISEAILMVRKLWTIWVVSWLQAGYRPRWWEPGF